MELEGLPKKRRSQTLLFARNFFKHPNMLGWMIPSSPFLVNQVLRQIDWAKAKVIVEYGPGVGTFTTEILRRMRPDATLIVIETNDDFVEYLSEWLIDPRLHLIHSSAEDVDKVLANLGLKHADYVVSGIPFKVVPDPARETIIRKTHSILNPNGAFLVYLFSPCIRPYLEKFFTGVRREFQWLNIMPARFFYCTR